MSEAEFSLVVPLGRSVSYSVVSISAIHVQLRRESGDLALDTTVAVADSADSVVLDLSVSVEITAASNPPTERFEFTIALTGPAGDTLFMAGPDTVDAVGAGSINALAPTLRYVGVGWDAASVEVTPATASLAAGDTLTFLATARDSLGSSIPGTPVVWSSLDTTIVSVARPDSGRVVARPQSGTVQVVARLLTGPADTASVTVVGPLAVTTSSLPDGTENVDYGTQTLTATGGDGSYSWAVVTGSLPTNLNLAANGDITGTPTSVGTSSFTVEVASGDSQTATRSLAITVNARMQGWTEKVPFPPFVDRRGVRSFSIGNKGYVVIPCSIGAICAGPFWEYDPLLNQWTRLADHPNISYRSPSFVLNGAAYVVIGTNVWQYAPGSDSWTQKGDIPGTDKLAGFGFSAIGRGYIGGGFYNGGALWEYDPVNDSWIRKNDHPVLGASNDPTVRSIDAVTFTIGNEAYLTGTNHSFWVYSPATDTWLTRSYVDAVYGQAFSIGSTGYVFNARGMLSEYDAALDQWTPVGVLAGQTICYPAGFAIGDSFYVGVGGRFADNTCNLDVVNTWWEFYP